MIEKDEDIEYGKWRQRRLDALDEEIAKDKRQPQFAKHEGPQKYATKDPWSTVPWRGSGYARPARTSTSLRCPGG